MLEYSNSLREIETTLLIENHKKDWEDHKMFISDVQKEHFNNTGQISKHSSKPTKKSKPNMMRNLSDSDSEWSLYSTISGSLSNLNKTFSLNPSHQKVPKAIILNEELNTLSDILKRQNKNSSLKKTKSTKPNVALAGPSNYVANKAPDYVLPSLVMQKSFSLERISEVDSESFTNSSS